MKTNLWDSRFTRELNKWATQMRKVHNPPDVADLHDFTLDFFKKYGNQARMVNKCVCGNVIAKDLEYCSSSCHNDDHGFNDLNPKF